MKKKNEVYGTGFSKGSFERMVKVNQGIDRYIDGLYLKEDIIAIVRKNLQKIICAFGVRCPYCKKESGLTSI